MKITYRVSQEDYAGAMNLFLANQKPRYRRVLRVILPWMGIVLLLLEVVSLIIVPHRDLITAFAGTVMALYFIYCGFAMRLYVRRAYRKNKAFQHEISADISDNGIHIVTAISESQLKWAGFIRSTESDKFFMLYTSEVNFITFPKSAFASSDIGLFQELLRTHITATS